MSSFPPSAAESLSTWQILATPRGKTLLLLALAIFSLFFMTLAIFPAAPLLAQDLHLSATEVSGIFGISSLIATLLSLPAGVLSDRNGRRPLIIGGLLMATLALLLCIGSTILPLFIVGWIVFGIGRGLFFSPMFTIPADIFDFRERGKAIGIVTGAVGLGSVVGYVAGGILTQIGGWRALFVTGAVLLGITTLIMFRLPETNQAKSTKSFGEELRGAIQWLAKPTIAAASVIAAFSFAVGICATFLTPFAAERSNISPWLIAVLFIPYEFVASVGAPVIGSVADKFGRKWPLVITLAFAALAVFGLAAVGISPVSLLIGYSLIGLTEGPVVALTTAIVIDQSIKINPRGIGAALGSYRIAQGLGLAFGNSIGGLLLDRFGIAGSYASLGGILVLLVLFALLLKLPKSSAFPARS